MSTRSIRVTMMLLIGGCVLAVQAALVTVVTRLGYESNLETSVNQMHLMTSTIATSLTDFARQ